ncbi:hypothetical protein G5C60_17550 [Streptomyces sp. HC44]|uniref:Integral membrane protein n=1 Tax=Streptomyces scabichelini TaxID=2711217 RepID=A0A6G4V5J2_9ACTN|nr:hypothetical protein [Streptomyces scabichelini]NGO09352.1 hypothetical protein [Streptomyces scabichelini]
MPKTLHVPLVDAERRGPSPRERTSWRLGAQSWPAVVAGAFTLAQLALVRPGMGLGWDEIVYVSQVSDHAPEAFFSAPRARGVSLLVAPIASWSSSTALLRVYLALLSGLGLFLALRVWRGLFPVRVVGLAGALFATLWVTLFYGPQAMPNYWVAIGALAGVGCFLRAQGDRFDRAALWGVGVSAALMALMRPTDAIWVTLPLLALLVCVRRWRRWRLLVALVAGLVAGAGEWVVEAYVSHGGLSQRLADASWIQGGLGWNFAIDDQARTLVGRTLCRPCTAPWPHPAVMIWWFVLPLLAALGVAIAVRAGRTAGTLLPLACAATAAFPYLFLIGYAAPRFLLPAYALLAIPVADALTHLVAGRSRTRRKVAVALVALGLAGHLAVQYAVLNHIVDGTYDSRRDWARTAAELHRLGVRPPCLLTGHEAIPIAFYARCSSAQTGGHNANTTRADIERTARRLPVAVLTTQEDQPPPYARTWLPHRIGEVQIHVAPAVPRGKDA